MSATVRQALATAASTVDGVDVSPYFRQTTKPGSGMVRYDRTAYPQGTNFGGLITWQVVIFLPQDQATAEKFLDEKAPLVVAALASHMRITDVITQQLALESGTVPIALIQGNREEEN
ncbi:hypothetical protein CLV56_4005 [Mumia flava]|uniref:Uncharacterized protein n=1 Tax=Mumia flava TaxID=1348852 RepID=A0A0B2BSQ7_9ACTN|nr:hypothetical protein [Mumia flava]PJJ48300.1 hypothetical protein CLV56_4005 [Mumia flava]